MSWKMVRGRARRTTYIYELKSGPRIVQYGITDDPDERLTAHENSTKKFTHMQVVRGPMSREQAEKLEGVCIRKYQRQHGGRPPKYNKHKTY